VLTGRKVQDDHKTRTNIYCLAVSGSGSGKERAREVNTEIMRLVGLSEMLGEGAASSAGLVSVLAEHPAMLFQIDEIGRYLKTLGDARQKHLYEIISVFMSVYTRSGSSYVGQAYAETKKIKTIHQPHAVIHGTTVPQSLYDSFTTEGITEGFYSRTLIFEGDADAKKQKPSIDRPPESLLDVARFWGSFNPGGNLSSVPQMDPSPIIIPTRPEAEAVFERLEEMAEAERRRLGDPLGPVWVRAVEQARKLALLRAVSGARDQAIIAAADAVWATELIDYLTRRMIYLASRHVSAAGSAYDAKFKRIWRIIDSAGQAGITGTGIANRCGLPAKERAEILSDLVGRGLAIVRENCFTGGRPAMRYFAARLYRV
jgi:hypothetical protein